MSNRFRKLTAWLGMLAVWLATAVPLVSQVNARPTSADVMVHGNGYHTRLAEVCGTSTNASHDGASHVLHLDACGYCAFFAHSPAAGSPSPSFASAHAAAVAPSVFARLLELTPKRYTHAYPRAPPKDA